MAGRTRGGDGALFWRKTMWNVREGVIGLAVSLFLFAVCCLAVLAVEVKPEIVADVAGVYLSQEHEEANMVATETHIEAADGSDVTSVSFTFAGLSGGAAVLVAVLCVLVRIVLGQRVALGRLVLAIEGGKAACGVEVVARNAWDEGHLAARKAIKGCVTRYNAQDDRAARIIDKHVARLKG